jgi:hypothetical protein
MYAEHATLTCTSDRLFDDRRTLGSRSTASSAQVPQNTALQPTALLNLFPADHVLVDSLARRSHSFVDARPSRFANNHMSSV